MKNGTRLAAVDLGSNSFRLEIGELENGQIHRVEYLKETVRLGNGLDSARNLTPEAMQRGWDALARFGERLAGCDASLVRAVATQTLREARNRQEFLLRGRTALGFGIDIIPGREEARLIYSGVTHMLPQTENSGSERRLVVDIGGRSTEMVLGQGLEPQTMESYRVGSVAWSMKHFPENQFTAGAFHNAEVAAKAVLDDALANYTREHWDAAYGASGTIGAVGDVLVAAGGEAGIVTRDGLDWLRERLLKAGHADKLRIDGMRDDRKPVIGGGLAVLRAVFDLLDIERMHVAVGALRHGVQYELLTRDSEVADMRDAAVAGLAERFGTDAAQRQRVCETAEALFVQLVPAARRGSAENRRSAESRAGRALRALRWAAQLHEIGTLISHSTYHKHGAYILDNNDVPGFTSDELHGLSQLVLGHRGKLRKLEAALDDESYAHQLLALRLAVILCHARRDPEAKALTLAFNGDKRFSIAWKNGWAEAFPQSAHLLREETVAWQKTRWDVAIED